MKRWSYLDLTFENDLDWEAALDRQGEEGWELVAVVPAGEYHCRLIFKAEIFEAEEAD